MATDANESQYEREDEVHSELEEVPLSPGELRKRFGPQAMAALRQWLQRGGCDPDEADFWWGGDSFRAEAPLPLEGRLQVCVGGSLMRCTTHGVEYFSPEIAYFYLFPVTQLGADDTDTGEELKVDL